MRFFAPRARTRQHTFPIINSDSRSCSTLHFLHAPASRARLFYRGSILFANAYCSFGVFFAWSDSWVQLREAFLVFLQLHAFFPPGSRMQLPGGPSSADFFFRALLLCSFVGLFECFPGFAFFLRQLIGRSLAPLHGFLRFCAFFASASRVRL